MSVCLHVHVLDFGGKRESPTLQYFVTYTCPDPTAATTVATPTASQGQSSSASSSTDEVKSKPKLPSFWVPSLTPDAKPTEIKKPVSLITSPWTNETKH